MKTLRTIGLIGLGAVIAGAALVITVEIMARQAEGRACGGARVE